MNNDKEHPQHPDTSPTHPPPTPAPAPQDDPTPNDPGVPEDPGKGGGGG